MVPQTFCISPSVEDIFQLDIWRGYLTHILYSQKYLWIVSQSIYSNAKCTIPEHDMSSSRRVMSYIRAGVCNCGPEFQLNWTLPKIQKAFLKTFPIKMKPTKWPAKDKKRGKKSENQTRIKVSPCSFHALKKKSFYRHEVRVNLDFSDSVDSRRLQV